MENTNLLISLIEELYDMVSIVDASNSQLYHMETMCNFFYHLKYRHIGESIKEKIHSLMPLFRPELKKLFKYITSELNAKSNNSPQLPTIQAPSKLLATSQGKALNMNVT
jgi:mediator of RNA polymerase II transcription subunit 23